MTIVDWTQINKTMFLGWKIFDEKGFKNKKASVVRLTIVEFFAWVVVLQKSYKTH